MQVQDMIRRGGHLHHITFKPPKLTFEKYSIGESTKQKLF